MHSLPSSSGPLCRLINSAFAIHYLHARTYIILFFHDIAACLESIQIFVGTVDEWLAGSSDPHKMEIVLKNNKMGDKALTTIPGSGDHATFTMDLSEFNIDQNCITINEIAEVSIVAGGTNGWKIESIATIFIDEDDCQHCGTSDFSVDQWIETESLESREELKLTLLCQ